MAVHHAIDLRRAEACVHQRQTVAAFDQPAMADDLCRFEPSAFALHQAPAVWAHRTAVQVTDAHVRSEEHTSELQSLMRISYAVFCLQKNTKPLTYDQPRHRYPPYDYPKSIHLTHNS